MVEPACEQVEVARDAAELVRDQVELARDAAELAHDASGHARVASPDSAVHGRVAARASCGPEIFPRAKLLGHAPSAPASHRASTRARRAGVLRDRRAWTSHHNVSSRSAHASRRAPRCVSNSPCVQGLTHAREFARATRARVRSSASTRVCATLRERARTRRRACSRSAARCARRNARAATRSKKVSKERKGAQVRDRWRRVMSCTCADLGAHPTKDIES